MPTLAIRILQRSRSRNWIFCCFSYSLIQFWKCNTKCACSSSKQKLFFFSDPSFTNASRFNWLTDCSVHNRTNLFWSTNENANIVKRRWKKLSEFETVLDIQICLEMKGCAYTWVISTKGVVRARERERERNLRCVSWLPDKNGNLIRLGLMHGLM